MNHYAYNNYRINESEFIGIPYFIEMHGYHDRSIDLWTEKVTSKRITSVRTTDTATTMNTIKQKLH